MFLLLFYFFPLFSRINSLATGNSPTSDHTPKTVWTANVTRMWLIDTNNQPGDFFSINSKFLPDVLNFCLNLGVFKFKCIDRSILEKKFMT